MVKEIAFRLHKGDDLRQSIEEKCVQLKIDTAIILSAVGCVYELNIRLADAREYLHFVRDHEIVSMTGTISKGKAHLHISLSDDEGHCIGGHLEKGCLINTTCEVVLGILEDYVSERVFDEDTGYDEICFREVDHD